jgi:hypothetical protein
MEYAIDNGEVRRWRMRYYIFYIPASDGGQRTSPLPHSSFLSTPCRDGPANNVQTSSALFDIRK